MLQTVADLKENAAGVGRAATGLALLGSGESDPGYDRALVADPANRHQEVGGGGWRWYVIRTKAQAENLASAALKKHGFELFFPRVKTPRSKARVVQAPLFPGYLFVRCEWNGRGWPSLAGVPGVFGWVSFGGVVPSVPGRVIAELAQRVEEINGSGGLWARYGRGERVRVVYGFVESLAEVVEEAKSPHARVRVLLEFMGRQVPAQVPYERLWPVSDGQPLLRENPRPRRRTRGKGRWIRGFGPREAIGAFGASESGQRTLSS